MAWTFAGKVGRMDNKLIRYPGHIAVINAMQAMGFFDGKPITVGKTTLQLKPLSAHGAVPVSAREELPAPAVHRSASS